MPTPNRLPPVGDQRHIGLKVYVLPPRKPKFNGVVERSKTLKGHAYSSYGGEWAVGGECFANHGKFIGSMTTTKGAIQ